MGRDRDGKGYVSGIERIVSVLMLRRFVEFESAADMKVAVEKLDGSEFKGSNVRCVADVCLSTYTPRPVIFP